VQKRDEESSKNLEKIQGVIVHEPFLRH